MAEKAQANTSKAKKREDQVETSILVGWKMIAKACSMSEGTVQKWSKKYGFPVLRGPNNTPVSFVELIKEWFVEYDRLSSLKNKKKPEEDPD